MSHIQLLDTLPGMVFILRQASDKGFTFEYCSKGVEALYALHSEALVKNSDLFFLCFAPEQRIALEESLQFCAAEQLDCQISLEYLTENQLRHHYFYAKPEVISEHVIRWHGQIIDRTTIQSEQISQLHNERLLTSLFELSPLGIGLIALDTNRFIKTNTALQRILQRTDSELQTLTLDALIAEHDASELQRQWLILQYQQHFEPHEVQYQLADGGFCDVLINGLRIEDEYANALLWIIVEDITERKVTERQLLIEKDRAEAAANAKSHFLASMSHEIRTPLNGVLGMLDILMQSQLSHEQHRQIDIAKNSGQTLLTLLNDILDFSKIDAGKLELDIDNVDLRHMVQQLAQPFEYLAKNKGLSFNLTVESDREGAWVKADVTRLRQIINNLLSNALKFTAKGAISLTAKCLHQNDHVIFTVDVTDSGIGLSAGQCEWLFQPFYQADASTTKAYGGTGLGLAICHRLIQMMGGGISVTSQPDQGATFSLWLSFSPGNAVQQHVETATLLVNIHWPEQLRILLVDDNSINCEVVKLMLFNMGLPVALAEHGKQAIDTLLQQPAADPFQLIIMDCMMPIMDGYQATAAIRQGAAGEPYRDIPILALTANALTGDKERCLAAGMTGYLSKPVTQQSLAKGMAEVLQILPLISVQQDDSQLAANITDAGLFEPTQDSSIYWDKLAFLKSLGQMVEMEQPLVKAFAQSLSQIHLAVEQAIATQNIQSIASISHSLKGSAAQMCCFVLADSAKKINLNAKAADLDGIINESACFYRLLEETSRCLVHSLAETANGSK